MSVFSNRSQNESLNDGATDGKYRKARPNTTVAPGMGEQLVKANRSALNPFFNYDFINSEEPNKVSPGSNNASMSGTRPLPVADTEKYMTPQNY
jgi:hypothetical protein